MADLYEELHDVAGGGAGELVPAGEAEGVQPRWAPADFRREPMPQQVGGRGGRINEAQQPLELRLALGVGIVARVGHAGAIRGEWAPDAC